MRDGVILRLVVDPCLTHSGWLFGSSRFASLERSPPDFPQLHRCIERLSTGIESK